MNKTGKGSFRGVPFLILEEQGINGGRRLVKHQYPLREEGLNEDLGKRQRSYSVNCLVIGDNHLKQAEKLIEALEKNGAGTLKHPYFGTLEVRVEDYRASHSTDHQRVTRFDISFVPDIEENAPLKKKNSLFAALEECTQAVETLSQEFDEMMTQFDEIMGLLTDNPLFDLADAVLGLVENVFSSALMVMDNLQGFKNKLMSFKNRVGILCKQPKLLAQALHGLVQASLLSAQGEPSHLRKIALVQVAILESMPALPFAQTQAQSYLARLSRYQRNHNTFRPTAFSDADLSVQVDISQFLKQAQANVQTEVQQFIQACLLVEYGRSLVQSLNPQASAEKILSRLEITQLSEQWDAQLEQLCLQYADRQAWQSYAVLDALRQALLADLRERGSQLAQARFVHLNATFPALAVAQRYTGKAQRWQQLVQRNHIRHPLFCLGGTEIEILDDAR